MEMKGIIGTSAVLAAAVFAGTVAAHADKVVKPGPAPAGSWVLIGQTHANHTADHDTIVVRGPFDNFRKIKFKVTDAPLTMRYMLVVYDNGEPDRIDVRQNIKKGGESRVIDLRGVGTRSIRRIDFWYDTKGLLNGKADVTLFGKK
jgi:hypothetical protein